MDVHYKGFTIRKRLGKPAYARNGNVGRETHEITWCIYDKTGKLCDVLPLLRKAKDAIDQFHSQGE